MGGVTEESTKGKISLSKRWDVRKNPQIENFWEFNEQGPEGGWIFKHRARVDKTGREWKRKSEKKGSNQGGGIKKSKTSLELGGVRGGGRVSGAGLRARPPKKTR